jgi:ubiquinone/menaquinone biosynthesis C-methylase UbiE
MKYVGADMRNGPGVDIILDLHDINLPSKSVGTVLCLDTLEHVEYPHRAMEQNYRILKPGGMVVISSVMDFPIHDYPCDYWRFTPEAFKSLLRPYESSYVDYVGKATFPHTIVGIGFKRPMPSFDRFEKAILEWKEWQTRKPINMRTIEKTKKVIWNITPSCFRP